MGTLVFSPSQPVLNRGGRTLLSILLLRGLVMEFRIESWSQYVRSFLSIYTDNCGEGNSHTDQSLLLEDGWGFNHREWCAVFLITERVRNVPLSDFFTISENSRINVVECTKILQHALAQSHIVAGLAAEQSTLRRLYRAARVLHAFTGLPSRIPIVPGRGEGC